MLVQHNRMTLLGHEVITLNILYITLPFQCITSNILHYTRRCFKTNRFLGTDKKKASDPEVICLVIEMTFEDEVEKQRMKISPHWNFVS